MDKKQVTITVIIAVVVAAAGFFGGMAYGKSNAGKNGPAGQFSMNGNRTGGNTAKKFGNGNDFVNGTVLSKDDNSITVQMRAMPGSASSTAAGSKIVILSGSTQISKAATGTFDDISVGTNVTAIGTDNTDGSITAQTVQIRPAGQTGAPMMRDGDGQTPPPAQ